MKGDKDTYQKIIYNDLYYTVKSNHDPLLNAIENEINQDSSLIKQVILNY